MLDTTWRGETPPRAGWRAGVRGHWFGVRFIPAIGGGSDDDPKPGEGDPPKGDDPQTGKDGNPFDAARAQATIDALRTEIKGLKGTSKEAETLRARLKEIEDKDKSEVERLAGTAKEAGEKLTTAEARARDLVIRLNVERAARKLGFIDEDDAYRLLDRSAVEMDDDGEPQNVDDLLKALAKAKPHLVQADDDKKAAPRGTPQTPKPNGKPATHDDIVRQETEQLRVRYGSI